MKQTLLQEKYPVFVAEIGKGETHRKNVEEIVVYLKQRIAERENVAFIGVFDHYAHTQRVGGEIAPDIVGAVDVMFCFGTTLPNPQVLAVRPRSIGIADLGDKFVISFLEAPRLEVNEIMEGWIKDLRKS